MATQFPQHARRDDPSGYMIVQFMVEFLRDVFDSFVTTVQRGSATVTAGTTTVVVLFGSSSPGSTYSVVLTPLADPTTRYWVSSKSTAGFTINLAVAAPVGGVAFDWIAKGA